MNDKHFQLLRKVTQTNVGCLRTGKKSMRTGN